MIKLDRDYASVGIISAGSGLYVYDDTLSKYVLLVPTSDMPAGPGAPDTIDNPLLTVSRNGQVEGKQTMTQKEYTYNWNRDNNRRLDKYAGKQIKLLERDGMEYTGWKYIGTFTYDKDAFADNEIMNGKIYVTINEDRGYAYDVRGEIAKTAIITSPLPEVTLEVEGTLSMVVEASEGATVTVESEASTIATATINNGTLTVTGVAQGETIILVKANATGEGESIRSFMVNVVPKSQ